MSGYESTNVTISTIAAGGAIHRHIPDNPLSVYQGIFLGVLVAFAACTGSTSVRAAENTVPGVPRYLAPVATETFHSGNADTLVWDDMAYERLLEALESLRHHGLIPEHYHLEWLRQHQGDSEARDRYATDAWLSAAAHMLYGKLDPVTVEPDWTAAAREADLAGNLRQALASQSVASSLEQYAPTHEQYQALKSEYRRLLLQVSAPGVSVPAGPTLRQGMTGERVTALQQRLDQLQLLAADYEPGLMDRATVEAARLFQEIQDLEPDGLVGPATLAALNLGQREKLDKIRVNLERWRWLPEQLGRRHVRVNIAGFSVTTWNNDAPVRTHLAVVGKTYRKTPVFSDEIEYLVFNPWWEVPYSIARIDKLPLFRQEPELVRELGFRVLDRSGQELEPEVVDWNSITPGNFPYRLRQAPGENNALGQVKIMFPNSHNVYLHDTPTRGLFEQRQRAFSSGCIRTQFPLDLSLWLLEETPGWDRQRIDSVIASGAETRVNLTARVPVHILYHTAVAESGGSVRFLDDIYQRDEAVLSNLLEAHQ